MDAAVHSRTARNAGFLSYAGQVFLVAVAYFAAAKLLPSGSVVIVSPAAGVALSALLLLGPAAWPGVWLGAALAFVSAEGSLFQAVLLAAGAAIEAAVAALMVRRCIGLARTFDRGEDVVEFAAIAALSAAIGATAAVAALAWSGSAQDLGAKWWAHWQADSMGIVIIVPLLLNWSHRGASRAPRKTLEMLCLALPTLAATQSVFSDSLPAYLPSLPLTFVILPFVIWAALRFEQREVVTLSALICAVAVWQTVESHGPFASALPGAASLLLLAFTGTVIITGLVLNAVVGERSRAIDALAQALKTLKEEAIRDPLTNLYNRRFLHDYLGRELVRAKREDARIAVLMIDLDHFKRVNDTAGHAAGDEVLVRLATLLKRYIRGSDIACRFGGEEFTLVLPNATLQSAQARAEAICKAVREEGGRLRGVTASVGVAVFPDSTSDPDALLRVADRALYEAKERGRDQVRMASRGPAIVSTLHPRKPRRAA